MAGTSTGRAYNTWWQARSDAWSWLQEASGQRAAAAGRQAGYRVDTGKALEIAQDEPA